MSQPTSVKLCMLMFSIAMGDSTPASSPVEAPTPPSCPQSRVTNSVSTPLKLMIKTPRAYPQACGRR